MSIRTIVTGLFMAVAILVIWKYLLPPQLRPAVYTPRVLAKEPGVKTEKATFAAGCFWGVEATFRDVPGVVATQVGYSGGTTPNPTYEDVCGNATGHAEAVEVEYDPKKVSYDTLLDIFWANHDPTTPNRQGPDIGTQYRSVIFYHTPEQQAEATASMKKLQESGRFKRPIVTQIVPEAPFYRAEEYHQQYLEKRGLRECHIRTDG